MLAGFRHASPINGPFQALSATHASNRLPGPLQGFLPARREGEGLDSTEDWFLDRVGGKQVTGDLLIAAAVPILSSSIDLSNVIVGIAKGEWDRWNKPHKLTETQKKARPMLKNYWAAGVGWNVSDAHLKSPTWQDAHPWSAAFISYVMRMAGAGDRFQYAAAHAIYIRWAIQNRLLKRDNPFKAYRINEVAPQPGDLVGKARSSSGANYDNIQQPNAFPATHCDIVTEVQKNQLVTIGGNVGDSVSKTLVPIDHSGHVNKAHYFVVIKVHGSASFLIEEDPSQRLA
jgi:hypothetical protein